MSVYKTEVKATDSTLFFTVPASFVNPLNWKKGDKVNVELVGNTIQISKLD